jgi:ArsR family transcriptional regulator, arsenate/arsenite/antimonite-responsive transcriptional repressor
VSHHLRVLRQAGLVESQRRGTWVWYAIRPEAVERLREVIDSFASAGAASLPADRRLPVLQARAAGLS